MKKLIAAACLLGSLPLFGDTCLQILEPALTWTGYKFTEKFGVDGSFENISSTFSKKAKTEKELFESVEFSIETASLNTTVPYRDKKLVLFVFGNLKDPGRITGKVKSFDMRSKEASAEIKLNGVSKVVPFAVAIENDKFTFTGKIDILDFGMQQSFVNLKSECEKLHIGKDGKSVSWSEVGLKVVATVARGACN